jgi:hypothetical protein
MDCTYFGSQGSGENWFAGAGDSPVADFPMLLHGPKREVNCLTETEGLKLKCHKVGTFGSYY